MNTDPADIRIEPTARYLQRVFRTSAPALLVLRVLVLGFLALVHFGPLKPIHECSPDAFKQSLVMRNAARCMGHCSDILPGIS
jgi:ABC-type molybdate transport system permease subunit